MGSEIITSSFKASNLLAQSHLRVWKYEDERQLPLFKVERVLILIKKRAFLDARALCYDSFVMPALLSEM